MSAASSAVTPGPYFPSDVAADKNVRTPLRGSVKMGPGGRLAAIERGRAGFTLAEVLAALLFMAIVVPVAIEGLHIASRAGLVAERKAEAARIAQRVICESVITTNWEQAVQSGTITAGARTFQYTLHNDPWTQDPNQSVLRQLTAEVQYTAQGNTYSVRMSTLVDSSQLY